MLLRQRIEQLESISQECKANSSEKSQAMAAKQWAVERKARVNLLGRQAVLIDEQRKIMVNMHKEHQKTLFCIACLERRNNGELQYNDGKK